MYIKAIVLTIQRTPNAEVSLYTGRLIKFETVQKEYPKEELYAFDYRRYTHLLSLAHYHIQGIGSTLSIKNK